MTAQGWFINGGKQIESNEIGAIDENNNELSLIPSTLGMNQNLKGPISPTELLDLSVTTVYSLLPDEISKDLENFLIVVKFGNVILISGLTIEWKLVLFKNDA